MKSLSPNSLRINIKFYPAFFKKKDLKFTLLSVLVLLTSVASSQDFAIFNTSNSGLPDNTVRVIQSAPDSSIWIGTDWGLANLKDSTWTIYNSANSGLPDNSIRSIAIDKNGNLWVGTLIGGLAVKTDTGWTVFNTANSSLPDDQIKAIAFDTAGYPWVGTNLGLVHIRDTSWTIFNLSNSIVPNNIASIFIGNNNIKWVGTINNGLVKIQDTTITVFKLGSSGIPDNTILSIKADQNNNLWMACPAGGIAAYNGSSWLYFKTVNSNSPTNSYNGIAISNEGTKYFSSLASGLVSYKGGTEWTVYDVSNSLMPEDELLSVQIDKQNNIWVGTASKGLVKFTEENPAGIVGYSLSENISISPNPFSSTLLVKIPQWKTAMLSIYDLRGFLVARQEIQDETTALSLGNIFTGIYLLEICIDGNCVFKKVIKN